MHIISALSITKTCIMHQSFSIYATKIEES